MVVKVGLGIALVILSSNAMLAAPATSLFASGQFYSELTPFGLGPAQYNLPPIYSDSWESPPPRTRRRAAPNDSYAYGRRSTSRSTVCTQIRNDYPERNFSCP